MKTMLFALFVFLFMSSVSFAWSVSPTTWNYTTPSGKMLQKTFTVSNSENQSYDITIAKSGELMIYFDTTSFTLNPYPDAGSSKNFIATVFIPNDVYGSKTSTISVSDGTTTKNILLNFEISKWEYETTFWVETNAVVSLSPGFDFTLIQTSPVKIQIGSRKDTFSIDESKEYTLSGNPVTEGNIKLTLIDMVGDSAKFKLEAETETTHSQTGSSSVSETEKLVTSPIGRKFSMQQNQEKKLYVTITNRYKKNVDIQRIYVDGDVTWTDDGWKPVDVEADYQTIGPGDELSYTVLFNTYDVEVGTYLVKTIVEGKVEGQTVSAETRWELTIKPSTTVAPDASSYSDLEYPESVDVNEEFEIVVGNLPAGADVLFFEIPEMDGTTKQVDSSTYVWRGKITEAGDYKINIWIWNKGAVTTKTAEISVGGESGSISAKTLTLDFFPNPPIANQLVTIILKDSQTNAPVDGNIEVSVIQPPDQVINKFRYLAPFSPELNKKYCISAGASGYEKVETCFEIGLKETNLIIEPNPPTVGQTMTIRYIDAVNNILVPNANIIVNGHQIAGATYSFTAEDKSYYIEAVSDGYEKKEITITPKRNTSEFEIPQLLSAPEKVLIGQENNWTFNRAVDFIIKEDGKEVAKGNSKLISFEPDKIAEYEMWINGLRYLNFNSEAPSHNSLLLPIVIIITVLIAIFLIKSKVLKKQKKITFKKGNLPEKID